jgi:hypothetical protein
MKAEGGANMLNRDRKRMRGEGAFGAIVGIGLLIVALVAGFKIIPLHYHGNEIKDAMNEAANFGGVKSLDKIQYDVYHKAQELGVPIPLSEVKARMEGSNLVLECKYTQTTEVFGYKYVYNFDYSTRRPTF